MTSAKYPANQQLTLTDAEDATLVARVTDLINEAYQGSEDGIWLESAARTSTDEVAGLVRANEIAVTRLSGEVVGCVRVQSLDAETSEFGMLAVDGAFRGRGIGRDLVAWAERFSRDRGHRRMQLKLLWPREQVHPFKAFLATWYTGIGYTVTSKGSMDDEYPDLAQSLAVPCDFLIYHKDLAASTPVQ